MILGVPEVPNAFVAIVDHSTEKSFPKANAALSS
jgi:hypothetical protein